MTPYVCTLSLDISSSAETTRVFLPNEFTHLDCLQRPVAEPPAASRIAHNIAARTAPAQHRCAVGAEQIHSAKDEKRVGESYIAPHHEVNNNPSVVEANR